MVLGQVANAFACRSTTVPAWRVGWATNRLLLGAVVAELAMLAGFLYLTPVADLFDQAPPPLAGFGVALLAAPAVLAGDTLHKAVRGRGRPRRWDLWPYDPPGPTADDWGIPTGMRPDGRGRLPDARRQAEVG